MGVKEVLSPALPEGYVEDGLRTFKVISRIVHGNGSSAVFAIVYDFSTVANTTAGRHKLP